ncbi:putative lytic murein transglycosylase [Aliivibrio wodanis]|uniref:Putative lytic murein transglycosylase n=1 Tax=Aliivibrio wodanis TaxID=80852 RepID=A0A090IU12_9GAMM|nr:putative lytic murein transglycosylase [Aliivibrio wodanis]VVV04601.1 Membrane-bound lytic murein transglycosylase B [Aliivibrio wodanis]
MKKEIMLGIAGLMMATSVTANTSEGKFQDYIVELKNEARDKGISEPILERAFKNIVFKEKAVKSDRNQPEKRLTLDEYIPRAVPKWKIKQANDLYKKHYKDLARIGKEYGVQPRFIVALWGVESNFGKFTGGYNVIEALTTLAYDGRREALFRKQTMAALTILQQGHITPENMKGSWAGAMGQCQFMPTSFLAYAVDGNGDGRKDIWTTEADVFASAANYLKQVGWDDTYTWGRQIQLPTSLDAESLKGLSDEKGKLLSQWQDLGIRRLNGKALPSVDIEAWLVQPDDKNGRAYLVYNNYQVLMDWNRSHYFALAVSHLADSIK